MPRNVFFGIVRLFPTVTQSGVIMSRMILSFCFMILCSCAREYSDFFPTHEDGTLKPSCVIVPTITDNSMKNGARFAHQFTGDVMQLLKSHGKIFVPRNVDTSSIQNVQFLRHVMTKKNLDLLKKYRPSRFVIFMELLDYKIFPYKRGQVKPIFIKGDIPNDPRVLSLRLRLVIVDIRNKVPIVIRQEIIHSNHVVSDRTLQANDKALEKGQFASSYYEIALKELSRQVSSTIENVTAKQGVVR